MRRRRAGQTNRHPLQAGQADRRPPPTVPVLALALAIIAVGLGACTGLAEDDPTVRRGPSGAAAVEESQAAAIATGGDQMVAALRRGGFVLVFQHASADRKRERRPDLTNCTTQRNLSATGRQQAVQLGTAVRALNIPIATVVTSPYCRARDTGWLAFSRAQAGQDLAPPPAAAAEAATANSSLRSRLTISPPPGSNTALVTHPETIAAALGVQLQPGEILAYQARPNQPPLLAKRFSIATLVLLAQTAPGGSAATRPSALP
jgi:Histidine phosphatase superfamily (branch 1)